MAAVYALQGAILLAGGGESLLVHRRVEVTGTAVLRNIA